MSRYSEHFVYSLIDEVKEHECIWNVEHEGYNHKTNTTRTWKDIATKLQLPEDLLRAKWKNLRDTYRKELKKCDLRNAQTPLSVIITSTRWKYFDNMGFLDRSLSIIDKKEKSTNSDSEVVDPYYIPDDQENYFIADDSATDPIPTESKENRTDEEYDVLFLESLLPFFRQLEPMRKFVFRSKIQELLMREISRSSCTLVDRKKFNASTS